MATAILDILNPDVWLVIDRWAAQAVFGKVTSRYSAIRYAAYARHLATAGQDAGVRTCRYMNWM